MTSTEETYKPIHFRPKFSFRPQKWLADELQTYMNVHRIKNRSEAIHYAFRELLTLREQQKAGLILKTLPQETQDLSEQDVQCDFLLVEGKTRFCGNRLPPIRLPPKLTLEACLLCQAISMKQTEQETILKTFNLNVSGRKRSQVAQALIGLQTQYDISKERIRGLETRINEKETQLSQVRAERDSFRTQLNEYHSQEESWKRRKEEFEKIDREFSEKKEALKNLTVIETVNKTLNQQVETLSGKLQESEENNKALKSQINDLKNNPLILCPEKSATSLSYCLKECSKYCDCALAQTNYKLSLKL